MPQTNTVDKLRKGDISSKSNQPLQASHALTWQELVSFVQL